MKTTPKAHEKSVRSVAGRLRERLERAAAEGVLGREAELSGILGHFETDGAVLSFVHGIGGIGKSALLAAVIPRLVQRGARVVQLDGRTIEPTPRGLLAALAAALGTAPFRDVEAMARELDSDPRATAIVIDEYDRIRLLDAWLRHEVLPAQPERTRWLFAGRFAPHSAWLSTPGWSDAVLSLRLEALDAASCRALLARRGIANSSMARMIELARGNPLALELAARYAIAPELAGPFAENAVLDALARRCVEDLAPALREAIDAVSIVRCATKPLLDAMLGEPCDEALLTELTELSFVERAADGLVLHESVRHAVASRLHALEPRRHRALRAAALAHLESACQDSAPTGPNAWRLTADLLFIVEHPEIREAFFPSQESTIAIDSALPSDREAVFVIAKRHESAETVAVFEQWWRHGRAFFDVARDVTGQVLGFAILAVSSAIPEAVVAADPLVRAWLTDLEGGPGRERGALFHRRVLSADQGEAPSDARGALWLAAKRAYVARPGQWALYAGTRQQASTLRLVQKFGFRAASIQAGDDSTLLLEFGAAGIWSWLRQLAREDLEPSAGGWRVVESSRGLLVDGCAVALSPLEYGALVELAAAGGAVVTRDELLDRVWKQRHTGSNVVDAVVRLLRKKLGRHAADIETVKGHGFRVARGDSRAE